MKCECGCGGETTLIFCACGCGIQFEEFDSRGRKRKYINGHYSKGVNNSNYGKSRPKEVGQKISQTRIERGVAVGENNPNFGKGLFGEDNGRYNGGKKMSVKRSHAKRRELGFDPVNEPLHIDDEVAHHLTVEYVAYVPDFINRARYHDVHKGENMDEINFYVLNYLFLVYNKGELK